MKASAVRRRLVVDLEAALRADDVEALVRAADRAKAVGVALASRPDDASVDQRTLEVPVRGAAAILGFHPEHVRRLIRTGRLRARRVGRDYRIGLAHLMPLLEARHAEPGRRRTPARRR